MKAVLLALCLTQAVKGAQPKSKTKVQAWYVNAKGKIDRDVCIRTQLEELNIQPNRYAALNIKDCFGKHDDFGVCVRSQGYGDCIKGGMLYSALGAHGSEKVDKEGEVGVADYKRHLGIVSNWCSHKRLFTQIQESNQTADYHLIFEDDVILRPGFKKAVADFIENYKGEWNSKGKHWDLVQIDPFGTTCDHDQVDSFRGNPIWKPNPHLWVRDLKGEERKKMKDEIEKNRCNEYWGFHAILVRKSAMHELVQNMENNPTVPLDWITGQYPNAIAWKPGISRNPEETNTAGKLMVLPTYCKRNILQSTLAGFLQKQEDVDTNHVTSGILHEWADVTAPSELLAVAPEK